MIEFFHKYQRSIMVYIFILVIFLSMTIFGVNTFDAPGSQYAVKVNDTEISYDEVQLRRRSMENNLRQQFGEQAEQLMPFFLKNVEQRIVDQFVSEALIDQYVSDQGLATNPAEMVGQIQTIFGGQFNQQAYMAYLSDAGMTATQFEARLEKDLTRAQFSSIVSDFSKASLYEARLAAIEEEKKLDVSWVEIDPATLESAVAAPTTGDLEEYYNKNKASYELPERVKYNVIALTPEDFKASIDVLNEDVELYYTEYEQEFYEPEQARVSHIELHYPKDNDPQAMLAVKEKAQSLHGKAVAGEDFAQLVSDNSEDLSTKLNAGSLGWITKARRDDALGKAVFEYGMEGIPDLVETDYGFHIVKVDEFQARKAKSLDSVRAEIVSRIKEREAPAYTLVKGEDLYAQWLDKNNDLKEFAEAQQLKFQTAADYLSGENEISPQLAGLTKKVLQNPGEPRQLLELEPQVVLLEIVDYQEAMTPEFAKISDRVKADFVRSKARELADARAREVLAAREKGQSLSAAAAAQGLKVNSEKGLGRSDQDKKSILKLADVTKALFKLKKPGPVSKEPIAARDILVLAEVDAINIPTESELKTKLSEYQNRESKANHQVVMDTLVNGLKIKSTIDIAPGLISTAGEV